jgi:endoglucanase
VCFVHPGLNAREAVKQKENSQQSWPLWKNFESRFISNEGRVIDYSSPNLITVSEGQAYAMFFALVANDAPTFNRILRWTENNLAQGDLSANLPSWLWGMKPDNSWGVIDTNAASDADLWIAYTLQEAGRLWCNRRFTAIGKLLAQRILSEETETIAGLGRTLLPAPRGFILNDGYRLNPSYMPIQLMQYFALGTHGNKSEWGELLTSSVAVIKRSSPKGFAPEWTIVRGESFEADNETRGVGSYNAIRVYLWLGMLSDQDRYKRELVNQFMPMSQWVEKNQFVPESIDVLAPSAEAPRSPPGFSASLVPLQKGLKKKQSVEQLQKDIATRWSPSQSGYYDHALILFANGFLEKRYRFSAKGKLELKTNPICIH